MTERAETESIGSEVGPWPDEATAFAFLQLLAGRDDDAPLAAFAALDGKPLTRWLEAEGLTALAHWCCRGRIPNLAAQLQSAAFRAAAETTVVLSILDEIEAATPPDLRLVALKGAALALSAYPDPALRSMRDLDLWLPGNGLETVGKLLADMGFRCVSKVDRPAALQRLSHGEVCYQHRRWVQGVVELHWSPLKGWWYGRTAAVNDTDIAARCVPIGTDRRTKRMAMEDMALHVATHLAVSNQFGEHVWRGLIDLALLPGVDWVVVAERARLWRVATAVWLTLSLLAAVLDLPEANAAAEWLRPGRLRRWLLDRFVSPQALLAGHDPREGRGRFLLLLLLVDRKRDAMRLIGRTLWPERIWLDARYGAPVSHTRHLWQVLRYGRV